MTLVERPTAEAEIAAALGADEGTVLDVFGAGWRLAPIPADPDVSGQGAPPGPTASGPWFVSGQPVQVMLRVTHESIEVAMPRGRRIGGTVVWEPGETRFLSLRDWTGLHAREVVEEFAGRRRLLFRFCRVCREVTAPEDREGTWMCVRCTARLLGA